MPRKITQKHIRTRIKEIVANGQHCDGGEWERARASIIKREVQERKRRADAEEQARVIELTKQERKRKLVEKSLREKQVRRRLQFFDQEDYELRLICKKETQRFAEALTEGTVMLRDSLFEDDNTNTDDPTKLGSYFKAPEFSRLSFSYWEYRANNFPNPKNKYCILSVKVPCKPSDSLEETNHDRMDVKHLGVVFEVCESGEVPDGRSMQDFAEFLANLQFESTRELLPFVKRIYEERGLEYFQRISGNMWKNKHATVSVMDTIG